MAGKTIDFMREAMKCAVRAMKHDDVPIGAVVVRAGKIIARGENRVQKNQDPTAHAEIVAIRAAAKKLEKKFLDGCDIYVTLEPCAMCATAISLARIKRVVFAAEDPKGGGIVHGARIYDNDMHLRRPEFGADLTYSATSSVMLKDFFKKRRLKNTLMPAPKTDKKSVKRRAKTIKKTIKRRRS
jgi:tRNA(Arg) A34 adenosine deaminase TadA